MRRRYIAVQIDSENAIDGRDFYDAVWNSILRLFGEHVASQTALSLIGFDPQANQATMRCSHTALDPVRAAIVAVSEIRNERIIPQILLVSGTLKALRDKLQTTKGTTLSQ